MNAFPVTAIGAIEKSNDKVGCPGNLTVYRAAVIGVFWKFQGQGTLLVHQSRRTESRCSQL